MKYKVLFMTLLSTLAIPYGAAIAMDWLLQKPFITSSHQAEVVEEAQNQAAITLSQLDHQIGGNGAVGSTQRLQTFTRIIDENATSLEEGVNNLNRILARTPGNDLRAKFAYLLQEREKEEITKQGLRREIDARKLEQAETNALLADVLQQQQSIVHQLSLPPETQLSSQPPLAASDTQPLIASPVLTPEVPTNSLSTYQQDLLSRRNQIGEEAWKLLGGQNKSLAAALLSSIQQNQGIVEVLSLARNNFTLRINGKTQDQIYKF